MAASGGSIIVRLAAAGTAKFKADMAAAGASINQLAAQSTAAAAANQAAARKAGIAMLAVGAAAIGAAALSAKAAIQLETRMNNVATIWTDTALTVTKAGDSIVDMSTRLPQSANNLAEGLYDIASSGFQGADALQVLRASATAASAGLTTTSTAAKGITAVLNAYGMGAGDAAAVSDILFQTVNLGVVTFEELTQGIGDYIGTAAVAGVSVKDTAAAFATMTLSGVQASEAGTSLNRVLAELIKPNEDLQAAFQSLGVASGQELLEKFGGLNGAVRALSASVGGNATALATLFPEMRALRGFLALNAAEGKNYARVQGDMDDEAKLFGATQAALAKQSQSTSFQIGILKNTVMAAAISFGQALLPVIKATVTVFQYLADGFAAIPGPLQTIILGGTVLTGIILALAGAYILLAPALAAAGIGLATFTTAAGLAAAASVALGAAVDIALGPIGWAVGAITLVVGALAMFNHGKQEAKRRTDDLKKSLDAENGSLTSETQSLIRNQIVKDKLNEVAARLGVSVGDVAAAMLGDAAATARVNAELDKHAAAAQDSYKATMANVSSTGVLTGEQMQASQQYGKTASDIDKLRDKIKGSTKEVQKAKTAWEEDKAIKDSVAGATDNLTGASKAAAGAFDVMVNSALADAEGLKELKKALASAFSPTEALKAADKATDTSMSNQSQKLKDEISDRYEVKKRAAEDDQRLEAASLEAQGDERKRQLERQHRDEMDAIELTQRAETQALEEIQQAKKNALDDDQRRRKEALDDTFRAERHALDRRLSLLDEEFDARKKAADKAYDQRKSDLEFTIRTSFGAQREAAIAELAQLELDHDHATAELERQQDDQVNVIKDGQEDSEQARKDGLDDTFRGERQAQDDTFSQEALALKDRQDLQNRAADDRYAAAKVKLDAELQQLDDALGEKYRKIDRALQDQQELENRKADERASAAKGKHELNLTDTLAALQKNNEAQEKKLEDLKTIWERSGRNLSTAMLTELQGLEPKVIAELADSGDKSFDSFMGAFRTSVDGVSDTDLAQILAPFNGEIQKGLKQLGEAGGASLMESVAKGLTNDPAGAEKVRQAFLALWTSPQGVLVNPQTGLRAALNAHGNIWRFADGGEHHTAQVAPPGAWRVWAEPETGGEAYIPLGKGKRERSTALLAEVASRFGYGLVAAAGGGVWAGTSSGGTTYGGPMFNVTMNLNVAAGVDANAVGIAVRRELDRALDGLARQVAVKSWRN